MAMTNTIDPATAAAPLAASIAAHVGPADVVVSDVEIPAASGMSNQTLFFRAHWAGNDHHLVARVQPTDGGGLFMTYNIEREHRLLSTLAQQTAVPVPRVWFAESDPALLGSPFLVTDRIAGRSPTDDPPFTAAGWLLDDLDAARRAALCDNALAALGEIHATDVSALGFMNEGADALGPLDQRLAYERRFYAWASRGATYPLIDKAFAWLDEHRPESEGPPVLNWGDARISNCIFDWELSVVGVVDWEMSCLGPRELDLGWWLFGMRHHTQGVGVALPPGFPDAEAVLRRYAELTGYTPRDIGYYEVLAGTRGAIMMVRGAQLMVEAGFLPPDTPMATVNPASTVLATLIGEQRPEGVSVSFIGNRS